MEIMVEAGDISRGDMVCWEGRWYVVKHVVGYGEELPADAQLITSDGGTVWVPVTELTGVEKRRQ